MTAPLARLRARDLSTGITGPYCTNLSAGHGASVINVEPPAPTLGQHNQFLLSEALGLRHADIESLERDRVIGQLPNVWST